MHNILIVDMYYVYYIEQELNLTNMHDIMQ